MSIYKKEVTEQQETERLYFTYLDELRDSGATNMFGAAPYLKRKFPKLSDKEAREILVKWMESF